MYSVAKLRTGLSPEQFSTQQTLRSDFALLGHKMLHQIFFQLQQARWLRDCAGLKLLRCLPRADAGQSGSWNRYVR